MSSWGRPPIAPGRGLQRTTTFPLPSPPNTNEDVYTPTYGLSPEDPCSSDDQSTVAGLSPCDDEGTGYARPPSPADSIISLTPSTFASSFQYLPQYGRSFNTRAETYPLPSDNEEIERLDLQHTIFQLLRGKNYCGPVEEVLAPDPVHEKAVLDLGCGTGLWAREMAAEFPHCEIVGIDLVPIQAQPLPPNCRIELDDITLGLEHFYGAFDVVHARLLSSGVQDFPRMIADVSQVLRPGGLLLLGDIPFQIFDSNRNLVSPLEPDPSRRSWVCLFAHSFCTSIAAKGGDATSAHKFEKWVKEIEEFVEVGMEDIWLPIGKWFPTPTNEEQSRMNLAGELVRRDVLALVKASKALLMSSGLPEPFVDSMLQSALQELSDLGFGRGQRLCGVFRSVWARKSG